MGGLDFSFTCPQIDRAIKSMQGELKEIISDVIEEVSPHIPDYRRRELADAWAADRAGALVDAFEALRENNSDMRRQAEKQIGELESRVEDLERQLRMMENE